MKLTRQPDVRAGLILAGVWVLVLVVAFIAYPRTDNAVTGFLVHAWFGLDALGALSPGGVLLVAMLQIVVAFAVGYLIGRLLEMFRGDQ